MKTHVAFDYEKQEWASGVAARDLRIKQLTEHVLLLRDPYLGDRYAKFLGADKGEAITRAEAELASLRFEKGE